MKNLKIFAFLLLFFAFAICPQIALAQSWPSDLDGGGNGGGGQTQRPKNVNTQTQRQSNKQPRQNGMIPVSKFGMNFQFPASWQTQEGVQDPILFIAFLPLADNTFRDNIVICGEQLQEEMSIEDYFDLSLKSLQDIKIVGKGKVTIDGCEGRVVRYTSITQNNTLIQQEQIYVVVDDKAYVVTITSKPDRFEQSRRDAYRLVNTITF